MWKCSAQGPHRRVLGNCVPSLLGEKGCEYQLKCIFLTFLRWPSPTLPSSLWTDANLEILVRKYTSFLRKTFTFLSSDLSVCHHPSLRGLRALPPFLLATSTHPPVFWTHSFLIKDLCHPSLLFLPVLRYFLRVEEPDSSRTLEPSSYQGPSPLLQSKASGKTGDCSVPHPPFAPPATVLWLLFSSQNWDSFCQSHHSFPSLLNPISPCSSRLFVTSDALFPLDAAPLESRPTARVLLLPRPLLATPRSPHPLCQMTAVNF